MNVDLLTPQAGLVALVVVVPLVAFLRIHRTGERIRGALALPEPRRAALLVPVLALVATAALLGTAAAQPVVTTTETARVRSDAEAFFVLDTTRSMLASDGAGSPRKDGVRMRSGHFKDVEQVGEWTTYDRTGAVYKVTTMKPKKPRAPA